MKNKNLRFASSVCLVIGSLLCVPYFDSVGAFWPAYLCLALAAGIVAAEFVLVMSEIVTLFGGRKS